MQPYLFLDVDGVLNTYHSLVEGDDLHSPCVEQLRRILKEADPEVVLSSTWRNYPDLRRKVWKVVGHRGKCTPKIGGVWRGGEIDLFLKKDPRPYVILDDDNDMLPEQMPNLIQTDPTVGLTEERADKVIELLKTLQKLQEC